jgi:hypothetical protein
MHDMMMQLPTTITARAGERGHRQLKQPIVIGWLHAGSQ